MRSTLRDETGARSAEVAARDVSAPAPWGDTSRQRYVVGVFGVPSDAYSAIAGLASGACEVLVVSDAALGGDAKTPNMTRGHVTIHSLDTTGPLAPELLAALSTFGPFAALGSSTPTGMPPPLQNLVHHLAMGAAVVIVHAPSADDQLRVSRALLDTKCDFLLTHDVLPSTGYGVPATTPAEDCCQNCTTRSCGQIDPPRDDMCKTPIAKD